MSLEVYWLGSSTVTYTVFIYIFFFLLYTYLYYPLVNSHGHWTWTSPSFLANINKKRLIVHCYVRLPWVYRLQQLADFHPLKKVPVHPYTRGSETCETSPLEEKFFYTTNRYIQHSLPLREEGLTFRFIFVLGQSHRGPLFICLLMLKQSQL